MTITTEEAEALARQADELGYPLYAEGLRALAEERDIANEQIYELSEERDQWKDRAECAERAETRALAQAQDWRVRAERAEAEAERLREALKPFAGAADAIEGMFGAVLFRGEEPAFQHGCKWSIDGQQFHLTWGQFRRARAALEGGDNADQPNEALKAMQDAERHGTGILLDGKRVPPEDFYKSPEEMDREARDREGEQS